MLDSGMKTYCHFIIVVLWAKLLVPKKYSTLLHECKISYDTRSSELLSNNLCHIGFSL